VTRRGRTLVLADAHLRGRADPRQAAMVEFLSKRAGRCDALVLLGDFFEFLAGQNRAAARAYLPVLEALAGFERLEIIEGNHDFDLSTRLPGLARARIHSGPADLELSGWRCRLFHGDRTLATDWGTRALRAALQSDALRMIRDRLLPDGLLFRFALAFAELSRKKTWPGRAGEAEAARARAEAELINSGSQAVLFAHTHHALILPCRGGVLANPGAAEPGGSYLELTPGRIRLRSFPAGGDLAVYSAGGQ